MATLDELPPDQRAVLQLVLQRGRSYDDIANMLSIDRAAVRSRALGALDALGPRTAVAPERRALITDYLLGQLPGRLSDSIRNHLADSPPERAWARVVASELAPVATNPLPEIPVEGTRREPMPEPPAPAIEVVRPSAPEVDAAPPAAAAAAAGEATTAGHAAQAPAPQAGAAEEPAEPEPSRPRRGRPILSEATRSSRRGGAILLAVALIAIVVAIVLITTGGGSKHNTTSSTTASNPTTTTTPTTTSSTSTTKTQVVGQINLTPPSGNSQARGVAEILKQGNVTGLALVVQHLAPNTSHNAYAVWLYNSRSSNVFLGFVNPPVGKTGEIRTEGRLPANPSNYKQVIITLETQAKPKQPGQIVLQGSLK